MLLGLVAIHRRQDRVAVLDWEIRLDGARDDQQPFFALKAA